VIRSEDDYAHTVVEVEESVRSYELLPELSRERIAPVSLRFNVQL
jgi:hypothetical protein